MLKEIDLEINDSGKSLSDLIEDGDVDATIGTSLPQAIRSNPNIARLFPNFRALEKAYYARTKIFPIMHLVAIKKEVYEKHPFVATSLYNAFNKSKNIALEKMKSLRALRYMLPWLPDDIDLGATGETAIGLIRSDNPGVIKRDGDVAGIARRNTRGPAANMP